MFSAIEEVSELQKEIGIDVLYTQTEAGQYTGSVAMSEYQDSKCYLLTETHSKALIGQGLPFEYHYLFFISSKRNPSEIILNSFETNEEGFILFPPKSEIWASTKGRSISSQLIFDKKTFESEYLTLFQELLVIDKPIFIPASIDPFIFENIVSKAAFLSKYDENNNMALYWPDIQINTLFFLKSYLYKMSKNLRSIGRPEKDSAQKFKYMLDYIRHNVSENLDYITLCKELNISVRTLERLFLYNLGITPKKYIHYYRMQQVKLSLMKANPINITVSEIAHKYGLTHMGRLAANYESLFQEKPSVTLSK